MPACKDNSLNRPIESPETARFPSAGEESPVTPDRQRPRARRGDRHLAILALIYVLVTVFTDEEWWGDTGDYVNAILSYIQGTALVHVNVGLGETFNPLWEFGHLLWRPIGWLCLEVANHLVPPLGKVDQRSLAIALLMIVNWVAGLAAVLLLFDLARRLSGSRTAAYIGAITFLCTNAVLNYCHTGSAYVPGVALLTLGVWILTLAEQDGRRGWRPAILSGLALGAAVLVWFPYVLAIPAALAAPLFLPRSESGPNALRARIYLAVRTGLIFGALTALIYGIVMAGLHIHTVQAAKAWVSNTVQGWSQSSAFTRFLFGLPHSVLHTGRDGLLFKRYLLHDPYAPVGLGRLLQASIWKLALFYLAAAAVVLSLLRRPSGRRVLVPLALSAIPVFYFAVFVFEPGSPERYLPIFPFFFVALACAWASPGKLVRVAIAIFSAAVCVTNLDALSRLSIRRQDALVESRVGNLAGSLKARSYLLVVNLQDELREFAGRSPFHPLNRAENLNVFSVARLGTSEVLYWRQTVAKVSTESWKAGGNVWVSTRLLAQRPQPDWNWAERDDPRISWTDFYPFFRALDMEQPAGNRDSFVLLLPTEKNRGIFAGLLAEPLEKSPGARR